MPRAFVDNATTYKNKPNFVTSPPLAREGRVKTALSLTLNLANINKQDY